MKACINRSRNGIKNTRGSDDWNILFICQNRDQTHPVERRNVRIPMSDNMKINCVRQKERILHLSRKSADADRWKTLVSHSQSPYKSSSISCEKGHCMYAVYASRHSLRMMWVTLPHFAQELINICWTIAEQTSFLWREKSGFALPASEIYILISFPSCLLPIKSPFQKDLQNYNSIHLKKP